MSVGRRVLLGIAAVAAGLGVAWAEEAFAIPKDVVRMVWLGSLVVALGFAAWAAWGYYRALRDDDDWD
jgi:hypothetical protein